MVCLSCRGPGVGLCPACRQSIRPIGEVRTSGGLVVRPWAQHEGAARVLVRRLKYEAVTAVAQLVAADLVARVPVDTRCFVPVTRAPVRRVRYGVDPAFVLARALSARTDLPVVCALSAPLWHRPNAGSKRAQRVPPAFRRRADAPGAVLVDDVLTTGATLDRAAFALGLEGVALTVTGVP